MTNENIRIIEKKLLSDNKYILNKIIFDQKDKSGKWHRAERETYDRGNGAATVSYTHLDVYKRQIYHCVLSQRLYWE